MKRTPLKRPLGSKTFSMRILIIALIIFMPCLMISCKKNDSNPPRHNDTFSASVNGKEFVPKTIEVAISGSSLPGTRAVHVYARDQNEYELFLYMYEYDGIKTIFNLDRSGSSLASYCNKDCGYLYSMVSSPSNNGEIKIVSFDKTSQSNGEIITGSFQFEADGNAGKFSVTNGHFSVLVPN